MEALKQNYQKIFSLKQAKKIVVVLIVSLFFEFLVFPLPSLASQAEESLKANIGNEQGIIAVGESEVYQPEVTTAMEFNGKLPINPDEISWSDHIVITAYNSDAAQTDDSPCITANGFDVCKHGVEDTIAANFLPFGAKVKIPELFGDKVFVVRDRMNRRFSHRIDVWMVEKPDAINFGVKSAQVQVLD